MQRDYASGNRLETQGGRELVATTEARERADQAMVAGAQMVATTFAQGMVRYSEILNQRIEQAMRTVNDRLAERNAQAAQ